MSDVFEALTEVMWRHVKTEGEVPLTVHELRCVRDAVAEIERLRGIEAAMLDERPREEVVREHRLLAQRAYWHSGQARENAIADALEVE